MRSTCDSHQFPSYIVLILLVNSVLKGGMKKQRNCTFFFLEFEKNLHISYKTVTGRFLPYVGWVTIIMTEKPIIKV